MIVKELKKSVSLQMYEALKDRLPKTHPKYEKINSNWASENAGYAGEKIVYRLLTYLNEKSYFIFHNIRLKNKNHFFQMDLLVITTSFILIIEVKNMAGILLFDESGQLIRKINEREEGFQNPIPQVQLQQRNLKEWLEKHHVPPIPVEYLVVISRPSSIIKVETRDREVRKRVLPAAKLLSKVTSMEETYKNEVLDYKQCKKLCKLIFKKHTIARPNLFEIHNLCETDILTGVKCPKCSSIPMIPLKAFWLCSNCNHYSKDAYIHSLKDYSLLISPQITNGQLRHFLHLSSNQKARKILIRMNFYYTGSNKGRTYFLP